MSVKLLALRSGFTTLTVTYQYKDIILRSMVTVGAYHPLKVSYELTLRYADVAWELQVLCCLRLWNVTTKCISWTKDGLEVWLLWRTLLTRLPCTMLKGSLVGPERDICWPALSQSQCHPNAMCIAAAFRSSS